MEGTESGRMAFCFCGKEQSHPFQPYPCGSLKGERRGAWWIWEIHSALTELTNHPDPSTPAHPSPPQPTPPHPHPTPPHPTFREDLHLQLAALLLLLRSGRGGDLCRQVGADRQQLATSGHSKPRIWPVSRETSAGRSPNTQQN